MHNHTHDVFLSTTECEIVSQAFPVPCATANVQYLQGTHGHTYKWDGMNITPITLHSSDIILLTAFPKRKKIQLQLSLIDKPQLDDLENLIQLQEVQSSVQALSKFFEINTIGEEHIDPQKVKDLGINAGIGSVAFVKMLLRNTIGAFLPSSWLIYTMFGLAIFIIILIISIVIYVKVCKIPITPPEVIAFRSALAKIDSEREFGREENVEMDDFKIDNVVIDTKL